MGLQQLILTQPPKRNITDASQQCENPNCVTNHEKYLLPEQEKLVAILQYTPGHIVAA